MIGILNAYHFDARDSGYQLEYSRIFLEFVAGLFPERRNQIKEYKVAQNQFPGSVKDCDIWFITGSPKSVYDDLPWVNQLKTFVQDLHANKIKTIGICFGHQMVALALGGHVSKSPNGWGVGVRSFELIRKKNWMGPTTDSESQHLALLFSHQDQVDKLPPGAELLAQDQFCPYQMLQIGNHILTLQGHPEFTVKFARERLISRKDKMSAETFEKAMQSFSESSDYAVVNNWIRQFVKL